MTKPKVKTQFEVGAWYTDDGVNIWKCIEYTPEPHVTLASIADGDTIDGLVSKFTSFVRMVPEADPPKRERRSYRRKTQGTTEETTEYCQNIPKTGGEQ